MSAVLRIRAGTRSSRPRSGARPLATVLLALIALPGGAGCRGGEAADADSAPEASEPHELVIFVYDRSMSIPDYKLELARELTRKRIATLRHGDRIAGLEVLQRSLAEPPKRWSQPVPDREFADRHILQDSVALQRFLKDAGDYLLSFSEPEGRDDIMGTDLLSTLHDVGEELRAAPEHRAILYLFSDMLQSTPEINMEGLRPLPGPEWVDRARERGILPDLNGLCVVVVGARVDTDRAQRVKEFWKRYFAATGAVLEDRNYLLRPVSLPEHPCGGDGSTTHGGDR